MPVIESPELETVRRKANFNLTLECDATQSHNTSHICEAELSSQWYSDSLLLNILHNHIAALASEKTYGKIYCKYNIIEWYIGNDRF